MGVQVTTEADARRACAVLGWRLRDEGASTAHLRSHQNAVVWTDATDRYRVQFRDGREFTVTLPTLQLAAANRDAPDLDVGECQECEGDGVQHWGCTNPDRGPNEWKHEGWVEGGGPQWSKHRACPACPPREKNPKAARQRAVHAGTGRLVVPAPVAVVIGAPRYGQCVECAGSGTAAAITTYDGHPGGPGWLVVSRVRVLNFARYERPCDCDEGRRPSPGHEGAREALRQLAEGWRDLEQACPRPESATADEILAVWGDHHREAGDLPPVLRAFAECPALPTWDLAWLAGACPNDCTGWSLEAIAAHLTAAWERETVECERYHAVVGGVFVEPGHATEPAEPCQRCAGLGRVTPVVELEAAAE